MRRPLAVLLALVAAAALTAHAHSLSAGLVFDDREMVLENPRLDVASAGGWRDLLASDYWSGPGRDLLWRPLTVATLAAQRLSGAGPAGYHAANLLLHAGVSVLLLLLALRLGAPKGVALLSGLLFAVHPLGSEAVTLVVGRADLLVAGCALAALLLLHRWAWGGGGAGSLAAAALLTAAACAAKESGFALPLLAALVVGACPATADAGAPPRWARWRRAGVAAGAVLLPALGMLALRWAVLGRLLRDGLPSAGDNPIAHAGFWAGRAEALRLLVKGLGLFAWPRTLSVDYSYAALPVPPLDATALVSVLAGLAAAGVILFALRRRPLALTGALLFLGAHLLTANLILPIGTIFAERLLYLPMAGLCLLAADLGGAVAAAARRLASGSPWPGRALAAAAALALAALGLRTHAREEVFAEEVTLWEATVAAVPRSAKARYNYGRSLAAAGASEAALEQYRKALEVVPEHLESINNLAAANLRRGRPERALAWLNQAAELAPGSAEVAFNRALALHRTGRGEEAVEEFRRGAGLDPALARSLAARGSTWQELFTAAAPPPPPPPAGGG